MAIAAYMARDGYYIAAVQGNDAGAGAGLTEWDNAQALFVVGELKAIDWFIGASVRLTKPKTVNINPMSSAHYQKRLTTGRDLGRITSTHFLQTAIFTYYVMGACTSVAANALRAITKDTDETPLWVGFHLEKEGTNTSQRKDIMGVVPNRLNISVSEASPIAKQTYTGEYSYNTPAQATDLAEPVALVQATHPPFTWYNYRSSSGTSAFTYNAGAAINVDIIGLDIDFGWSGSIFGAYDANGYPNIGYHKPPFTARVTVECVYKDHTGADIQTISDLDHAAQAGDLTLIVNFYEDATNYIEYTFTDMFIDPESFEEVFQSEGDWFDGFRFDLVFRNETSSLAVACKDALGDTLYANP